MLFLLIFIFLSQLFLLYLNYKILTKFSFVLNCLLTIRNNTVDKCFWEDFNFEDLCSK